MKDSASGLPVPCGSEVLKVSGLTTFLRMPVADELDTFRPMLLSPPCTGSPHLARQLSPLRPSDSPVRGKGLERARFEELLKASRERNAAMGGKREADLRKEIAMKVHRNKQGKSHELATRRVDRAAH